VFILAEEGISGTGSIDMSGDSGYNGGGAPVGLATQAGGGGGGAGGSAGKVTLRYPVANSITPSVLANGGSGGSSSPGGYFDNGANGSAGSSTTNDIGTY
jgi:hypothetical protein